MDRRVREAEAGLGLLCCPGHSPDSLIVSITEHYNHIHTNNKVNQVRANLLHLFCTLQYPQSTSHSDCGRCHLTLSQCVASTWVMDPAEVTLLPSFHVRVDL